MAVRPTRTNCPPQQPRRWSVANIVADPAAVGERVLLYGTNAAGKGVIVHFDFSSLHERPCDADDYELWTPSSSAGMHCYLGVSKAYKRRLREAQCYNLEVIESVASEAVCACTREDYACDECYVQKIGRDASNTCERDDTYAECAKLLSNETSLWGEAPLNCEGTWTRTRGYLLVEGTRCTLDKGVNLLPEVVPCPERKSPFGPGYIALAVCALLVIVGSLIGAAVVWRRCKNAAILQYGQLPTEADDDVPRHRRAQPANPISSRVVDDLEEGAPTPQVASVPEDFNPRAQ